MNKRLNWKILATIYRTNFVNKTLIWVIIVPILAKVFSKVDSTLNIKFMDTFIIINLELPFSWIYFYFSALSFLLANIIYKLSVPSIIDENHFSYMSFLEHGKGNLELRRYIENGEIDINDYYDLEEEQLGKDIQQEYFWKIWNQSILLKRNFRYFIAILYILGFIFISIVFLQNLLFVFSQI